MKHFNYTSSSFKKAFQTQQVRLEVVNSGWLSNNLQQEHDCPFCGANSDSAKLEISKLVEVAKVIETKTEKLDKSKSLLDKEVTVLEKQVTELENQLNRVRKELSQLSKEYSKLEDYNQKIQNVFRYVGRIEQNLINLKETEVDGSLKEAIGKIELELSILSKRYSTTSVNNKLQVALKTISNNIINYKKILKVENYSNPTELHLNELTLKISSKSGREDYLWEIGSGSNWMGYHLSALLALHDFFLTLNQDNYVPSFMVFDQPSQAYFPETIKSNKTDKNEDTEQLFRSSDDYERVKSIFKAFSKFNKDNSNKAQIIVLEHADREIWGDIENMHYVGNERWTKNNALIPQEWIE
ncbi:DUF3732 domain-containing protein [Pontibacter actiniarum]|nr:DUF3732 domain-containing protein [Pontibacter actiniarum]